MRWLSASRCMLKQSMIMCEVDRSHVNQLSYKLIIEKAAQLVAWQTFLLFSALGCEENNDSRLSIFK